MPDIDAYHASHIGRVKADFYVSARDLDPNSISQITGLQANRSAKRGQERRNYGGELISPHDEGFWMISSEDRVESKDLNDHIGSLLTLLLPHKETISELLSELKGEAYFDVLWTSNYLYAGTGPLISREVLGGMSDLGASIGFDIYQEEIDAP